MKINSNIEYNITKDTVVDILSKVESKGLYTMQGYVSRKVTKIPDEGIYTHILPTWKILSQFLYSLEKDYKDLFTERVVGEGPVHQGEAWGTFVDLFPTNKQKLNPIYNDFLDTISFGIGKKYKMT